MIRYLLSVVFSCGIAIGAQEQEVEKTSDLQQHRYEIQRLRSYPSLLLEDKCFLRPQFPEDALSLMPLFSDKEEMKYFGAGVTRTLPEVQRVVNLRAAEHLKVKPQFSVWSIINHDGCAGLVGVSFPKNDHSLKEIFYGIIPSQKGKGLTTTAGIAVLNEVGGSFEATVHPKNKGSEVVLQKLGFVKDKARQGVQKFGSVRDYYLRIIKDEDAKALF